MLLVSHRGGYNECLVLEPSADFVDSFWPNPLADALHARTVRIYKPTKNTMQSGHFGYNQWKIDWDVLQGSGRWENDLMGWGSS